MVGVRVRADDGTQIRTAGAPQAFDVRAVVRARVDGDVAAGRVAHDIAVGAGAGHDAGIGRGQPRHEVVHARDNAGNYVHRPRFSVAAASS